MMRAEKNIDNGMCTLASYTLAIKFHIKLMTYEMDILPDSYIKIHT